MSRVIFFLFFLAQRNWRLVCEYFLETFWSITSQTSWQAYIMQKKVKYSVSKSPKIVSFINRVRPWMSLVFKLMVLLSRWSINYLTISLCPLVQTFINGVNSILSLALVSILQRKYESSNIETFWLVFQHCVADALIEFGRARRRMSIKNEQLAGCKVSLIWSWIGEDILWMKLDGNWQDVARDDNNVVFFLLGHFHE